MGPPYNKTWPNLGEIGFSLLHQGAEIQVVSALLVAGHRRVQLEALDDLQKLILIKNRLLLV